MVSVTRVDTTGDLRYARVYVSVLDKSQEKDVLKGLKSASGFLRRELGRALSLRYTPELVFEAAALLRSFDNVLILTHVRPDGDTVGCAAALCAGLRGLGRTAYLLPNPGLTDTTAPYFAPYGPG